MAIMVTASFNWHNVIFHNFRIHTHTDRHEDTHREKKIGAQLSRCSRTRCNVVIKYYLFQCLKKKRELKINNNKEDGHIGKAHNYGCRIEANNK